MLIVGNAWNSFSTNEIEAVRQYVSGGGGLLLLGLGWSWLGYHSGATMDDYPMSQMAAPYAVDWLGATIYDPSNQSSGATVFHTFYPNCIVPQPTLSRSTFSVNQSFSFTINFEPGRNYRVLSSTNLTTWTQISNFVSSGYAAQITNSAANVERKFYRVVTP